MNIDVNHCGTISEFLVGMGPKSKSLSCKQCGSSQIGEDDFRFSLPERVKNSHLDTPVAEERNDVRLLPVPQGAVADGINI